jgi:hypothetical protein
MNNDLTGSACLATNFFTGSERSSLQSRFFINLQSHSIGPHGLSDYAIRSRQHDIWDRDADLLRGFQIDHQLKFL